MMDDLLKRMKDAEHSYSDNPEAAHIKADRILCEALRFIAKSLGSVTLSQINELIASYERVEKWYS